MISTLHPPSPLITTPSTPFIPKDFKKTLRKYKNGIGLLQKNKKNGEKLVKRCRRCRKNLKSLIQQGVTPYSTPFRRFAELNIDKLTAALVGVNVEIFLSSTDRTMTETVLQQLNTAASF